MKIAVLFPGKHLGAAWGVSDGVTVTLRRMGHEVEQWPLGRSGSLPLVAEHVSLADVIVVTGLEHLIEAPDLGFFAHMTPDEWKAIPKPKLAWFHESLTRDDRSWDFKTLRPFADEFFFPAWQDAVQYDQLHFGAHGHCHWLPFGVDTEVFKPQENTERIIPVGFIGSFYPKRAAYVNALSNHMRGKVPFIGGGGILVQDIEGPDWEGTAHRLAYNYNRIQIFLNLPAYSRLLVTKVFEAMACGCLMVTPALTGQAENNMTFEHTKQIVYYKESNQGFLTQILREFMEREADRRLIAALGQQEVLETHSLEKRLKRMFELAKIHVGEVFLA